MTAVTVTSSTTSAPVEKTQRGRYVAQRRLLVATQMQDIDGKLTEVGVHREAGEVVPEAFGWAASAVHLALSRNDLTFIPAETIELSERIDFLEAALEDLALRFAALEDTINAKSKTPAQKGDKS